MKISEFQELIREIYFDRDSRRGMEGTFMWLVEEIGELANALKRGNEIEMREEFSDVLAWLVSLASICGIDMERAIEKYAGGCPKCGSTPCACPE
ncbi:MAG: MazG nucleotide pyrophosphohydrolase domain-containing protein [bacterium]